MIAIVVVADMTEVVAATFVGTDVGVVVIIATAAVIAIVVVAAAAANLTVVVACSCYFCSY